jgi:polyphosphate kinase
LRRRAELPDREAGLEELAAVRERVVTLTTKQTQIYSKSVLPQLAEAGVALTDWEDLGKKDRDHLRETFEERIFPILTPLSVDPAHPFPYISSLSLNLAIVVRDPQNRGRRLARVKVPASLPRFLPVVDGEQYVPLEQVIAAHADLLFPGMELVAKHVFRVTRDADVEMETAEDEDLMSAIEEGVPADVLSASLYVRFRSRQEHTFAEKILSAMRQKFGGHIERAAGG